MYSWLFLTVHWLLLNTLNFLSPKFTHRSFFWFWFSYWFLINLSLVLHSSRIFLSFMSSSNFHTIIYFHQILFKIYLYLLKSSIMNRNHKNWSSRGNSLVCSFIQNFPLTSIHQIIDWNKMFLFNNLWDMIKNFLFFS